jgi:hypothetical protein
MLRTIADAYHRFKDRAERRLAYELLLDQSDDLLRDIGQIRCGLYHAVMHGPDAC